MKWFCGAFLCTHYSLFFSEKNKTKCQSAPFFLFTVSHILFEHPDTLFDAAADMTREDGQKKLLSTY